MTVSAAMPLTDLLVEFQKGKSHMALVVGGRAPDEGKAEGVVYKASLLEEGATVLGILTFEDVIERALGSYAPLADA